ncbi:hypothetical protein ATCC90586_005457 [Pythium insidiosum]|nr:hypothetical protein ATCC90586_005457 [Pythium insidiosum]
MTMEDQSASSPPRDSSRSAHGGSHRGSRSNGGSKSRKRGFLENSNLTDQDRRQVRWKERELYQDIRENASELATLNSKRFQATTDELEEMYEDVCYPREANLDASNLDELNMAVAKQSQSLGASDLTKVGRPHYEFTELVRASREACGADDGKRFDWYTLGSAAGACFRSVPEISFLFGLMDTQVVHKERKRTRRARDDEDVQASQPSEYTSKARISEGEHRRGIRLSRVLTRLVVVLQKDRKDAQARRLEVLQNKMEEVRKRNLFDVVIDRQSFTQTVENLFDMSFLVRNGAVEIALDEQGLPHLENHEGRAEENIPAQSQSIISITPAQWAQLAETWQVEEPLEQIRKIVLACGGEFDDDLRLDCTTHLIADAVGSQKHRAAARRSDIRIATSRWVFESYRAKTLLDPTGFALQLLDGLVICTTGLASASRTQVERLAELHGAVYDPSLEVGRTDVLIAQTADGAKYEAAVEHGIPVVHISWLHACVEKNELVDEAAYTLESIRRPLRLYKQLRQDLDDWMAMQLPSLARELTGGGGETHVDDASLPLLESCGVFLLGFPDEMESQLQYLVRFAMGSLYYDPQFPAVSHVIVSPVLSDSDLARLDQLEEAVVTQRVDALVHFVSARWLIDSLRCRRIEPEEMYPVEIEDSEAPVDPPTDQNAALEDPPHAHIEAPEPVETSFADAPEPMEEDAGNAETAAAAGDTGNKLFQGLGFLLLCQNPDEPVAVGSTVRDIQSKTGALAIALDVRDVGLVDPAQFDFVTHVVICSGIAVPENEMDAVRERFAEFHAKNEQRPAELDSKTSVDADADASQQRRRRRRHRLKVVSDLWVRCCLAADCLLSPQAHELFALTYQASRSMFPVPLPLACFREVVASTSVYVGVDRVVVMELLRLAGATVTSKLSKRNTHLICLHPVGMKYDKAKQWGLAIVTARWVVQSVIHGELLDASLAEFQLSEASDKASS